MAAPNALIQATGKLQLEGVPLSRGTAWLCGRNRLLTAAHCLKRPNDSGHAEEGIVVTFPWAQGVRARRIWLDTGVDAALLEVVHTDLGVSVTPLRQGHLPPDAWPPGGADSPGWYAYGFPKAWPDGLYLTGDLTGQLASPPAIQVNCDQGGYELLDGASGAAVCVRGSVVGIIREAILMQRVIFVSPLEAIRQAAVNSVEWPLEGAEVPYHPLHAVPPGPGLTDFTMLPEELIKAFAHQNMTYRASSSCLFKAIRMRRDAAEPGERVSVPDLIVDFGFQEEGLFRPYNFWKDVFMECFKHGPRMVYALLLTQPVELLDREAVAERNNLIAYLKSMWGRYSRPPAISG
jgi:hypothetical protein